MRGYWQSSLRFDIAFPGCPLRCVQVRWAGYIALPIGGRTARHCHCDSSPRGQLGRSLKGRLVCSLKGIDVSRTRRAGGETPQKGPFLNTTNARDANGYAIQACEPPRLNVTRRIETYAKLAHQADPNGRYLWRLHSNYATTRFPTPAEDALKEMALSLVEVRVGISVIKRSVVDVGGTVAAVNKALCAIGIIGNGELGAIPELSAEEEASRKIRYHHHDIERALAFLDEVRMLIAAIQNRQRPRRTQARGWRETEIGE